MLTCRSNKMPPFINIPDFAGNVALLCLLNATASHKLDQVCNHTVPRTLTHLNILLIRDLPRTGQLKNIQHGAMRNEYASTVEAG